MSAAIRTHLKPCIINKTHTINAVMFAIENDDRHSRFEQLHQLLWRSPAFVMPSGEIHLDLFEITFTFDIFFDSDNTS